ncbi:MAG: LysM peptidoglycan-binding domain-containing protein [Chloroflexi bacterium]|nr:LysM peptidoglycan-binding domain-containing protein [Chloroflexota bacterium]
MSNASLAYYNGRAPASILNSPCRARCGKRLPVAWLRRPASSKPSLSIALRLLIAALLLALTGAAQAQRTTAETHIVRPGESMSIIAAAYGVSLNDLQALNNIWTSLLYVGHELAIPAGGSPPEIRDAPPQSAPAPAPRSQAIASAHSATIHAVARGETLFSIARQYGISLDALIRFNGIEDVTRIHAGNELRVSHLVESPPTAIANDAPSEAPAAPQAAPAAAPAAPAARALPVVTTAPVPGVYPAGDIGQYTVRPGEFLTQLGVRFNMDWRVLADINDISHPFGLRRHQILRMPSFAEYLSYLPDNSSYRLFYTTHHHPGPRVGVGKEIVIELGRQSIYAYENGALKKRALMSSGKMVTPTVLGDYEIYRKYRSQTMSGPGYSLDNVEWPMYFYAGYAIHGTWWHTMFGTPMSHGCVNLTNADAQWFWEFAPLGTPVHVRH